MIDISSQADNSEVRARILLALFTIRNRSSSGDWRAGADLADARSKGDLERAEGLRQELTWLDEKAFELEGNVHKAAIGAAESAKRFVSNLIGNEPSNDREESEEVLAEELARIFDEDIKRAKAQLHELRNQPLRDFK